MAKRLPSKSFEQLINSYARGETSDYQMAAFLMAGSCNGFSDTEAAALTSAMLKCGLQVDLSDIPQPKVDKHSTGGVGDKITLIASPIAAAAGIAVPTITDRGLGYTGGTLDKLQAIPGFRTELPLAEFRQTVSTHGLAFTGQTKELAPADRKLFALRDATATTDCLELIAASIMSKKLAEGIDGLVLDVKVGRGSLIRDRAEARRLAQLMITIGRRMDVRMQALLTDMNQPLGFTIGNALEVMEVSQTLQGQGPADLVGLSVEIAARMIYLGEPSRSLESARDQAQQLLADGSAFAKLQAVIEAQGGDPNVLQKFELLPNASGEHIISSPRAGFSSAALTRTTLGTPPPSLEPVEMLWMTPSIRLWASSCNRRSGTRLWKVLVSALFTTPTRRICRMGSNWSKMPSGSRPLSPNRLTSRSI